jgi:uncharacterized membrane protein YfcA
VNELAAIVIGFAAGAVAGLMGVGGGILFVPALTLLLNESQLRAESTSLLAIIPVAIVGAWRQHRYGNVQLRDGLVIGALSPVGVLIGAVVSNNVPERALEIGFAGLILFVAAQLVRRALAEDSRGGESPSD